MNRRNILKSLASLPFLGWMWRNPSIDIYSVESTAIHELPIKLWRIKAMVNGKEAVAIVAERNDADARQAAMLEFARLLKD